jgi:hypothetical protein
MERFNQESTGKRLANKGRQSHKILTVNGEVKIVRRWRHGPQIGSVAPADAILAGDGATITPGAKPRIGYCTSSRRRGT